ncbi:KxYKxGKxW signal peptide domain-containing protein [Listeria innocua]|nr:KxYKxGKxW signal peptide domain-containing protein [Listeria innocua]MBC1353534.1 KxYKxGKxW signal peptide domain-containing protein [Listeria innocua]
MNGRREIEFEVFEERKRTNTKNWRMWKKGKQWLCGAALFLRLFRHQECW